MYVTLFSKGRHSNPKCQVFQSIYDRYFKKLEAFLWKFQYVEGHLLLERGLISFQNEKIEEPSKLNVDISKSSNFSLVVS